jgi:hypothetical protein
MDGHLGDSKKESTVASNEEIVVRVQVLACQREVKKFQYNITGKSTLKSPEKISKRRVANTATSILDPMINSRDLISLTLEQSRLINGMGKPIEERRRGSNMLTLIVA